MLEREQDRPLSDAGFHNEKPDMSDDATLPGKCDGLHSSSAAVIRDENAKMASLAIHKLLSHKGRK